jgi:hypothetical protein
MLLFSKVKGVSGRVADRKKSHFSNSKTVRNGWKEIRI